MGGGLALFLLVFPFKHSEYFLVSDMQRKRRDSFSTHVWSGTACSVLGTSKREKWKPAEVQSTEKVETWMTNVLKRLTELLDWSGDNWVRKKFFKKIWGQTILE